MLQMWRLRCGLWKILFEQIIQDISKKDFIELSEVEEDDDEKIKADMNRLHKEK